MPTDDYTVTTDDLRWQYVVKRMHDGATRTHAEQEWRRAMDEHDARVRAEAGAQALRDAAEDVAASRGYGLQYPDGDRIDIGSDPADAMSDWLHARADTITQETPDAR